MAASGFRKLNREQQDFLGNFKQGIKKFFYCSIEDGVESMINRLGESENSSIGLVSNGFAQVDTFYLERKTEKKSCEVDPANKLERDIRELNERLKALDIEQRKKIRPILKNLLSDF